MADLKGSCSVNFLHSVDYIRSHVIFTWLLATLVVYAVCGREAVGHAHAKLLGEVQGVLHARIAAPPAAFARPVLCR
jgi:hypothetical protein